MAFFMLLKNMNSPFIIPFANSHQGKAIKNANRTLITNENDDENYYDEDSIEFNKKKFKQIFISFFENFVFRMHYPCMYLFPTINETQTDSIK